MVREGWQVGGTVPGLGAIPRHLFRGRRHVHHRETTQEATQSQGVNLYWCILSAGCVAVCRI